MKKIEDIERMEVEELEAAALKENIRVPDGLKDRIKATLAAARNVKHNKLWVIFQPHTYTRTKALFDEFVDTRSNHLFNHFFVIGF